MAAAELQPTTSGLLGAGGRQIFWERFGTGARETVCLLNGLAMHTMAWYPFVPALLDECGPMQRRQALPPTPAGRAVL